jgi:hypothetical protein
MRWAGLFGAISLAFLSLAVLSSSSGRDGRAPLDDFLSFSEEDLAKDWSHVDTRPLLKKLADLDRLEVGATIDVVLVGFDPGKPDDKATPLGVPVRWQGAKSDAVPSWPGKDSAAVVGERFQNSPGEEGTLDMRVPANQAGEIAAGLEAAFVWNGKALASVLATLAGDNVHVRPPGRAEWLREGGRSGVRVSRALSKASHSTLETMNTAGELNTVAMGLDMSLRFRVTHARRTLWRAVQSLVMRQLLAQQRHDCIPVVSRAELVNLLEAHHDTMGYSFSVFVLHPRVVSVSNLGGKSQIVPLTMDAGYAVPGARSRLANILTELAGGDDDVQLSVEAARYTVGEGACSAQGSHIGLDSLRRIAWIDVGAGWGPTVTTEEDEGAFQLSLQALDSGLAVRHPTTPVEGVDHLAPAARSLFPLGSAVVSALAGMGRRSVSADSRGMRAVAAFAKPSDVALHDQVAVVAAWPAVLASAVHRLALSALAVPVAAFPRAGVEDFLGLSRQNMGVVVRVLVLQPIEGPHDDTFDPDAPPMSLVWLPCDSAEVERASKQAGLGAALGPLLNAPRGMSLEGEVRAECAVIRGCVSCDQLLSEAVVASRSETEGQSVHVLEGEALAWALRRDGVHVQQAKGGMARLVWSDMFPLRDDKGARVVPAVLFNLLGTANSTATPEAVIYGGPLAWASLSAGVAVGVRTVGRAAVARSGWVRNGESMMLDASKDASTALAQAILSIGWGIPRSGGELNECRGAGLIVSSSTSPWRNTHVPSHHRECWSGSTDLHSAGGVPVMPGSSRPLSSEVIGDAEVLFSVWARCFLAAGACEHWPFPVRDAAAKAEILAAAHTAVEPLQHAVLIAAAHSPQSATEPAFLAEEDKLLWRRQWNLAASKLSRAGRALARHEYGVAKELLGSLQDDGQGLLGQVRNMESPAVGREQCPLLASVEAATVDLVEPGLVAGFCPNEASEECVAKHPTMQFRPAAGPAVSLHTVSKTARVAPPTLLGEVSTVIAFAVSLLTVAASAVGGWVLSPWVLGSHAAKPMRRSEAPDRGAHTERSLVEGDFGGLHRRRGFN